MSHQNHPEETVGVRYTGWAALNRDPQEDQVDFVCPHCGQSGTKQARRQRLSYHFTDGFVQDLQGETTTCRNCRRPVHIAPVVMLHNRDEMQRFRAIFPSGPASKN
jgi:predicted RNA-binding Zn-ribbon protein involved in translation (DUF1610 family)